MIAAHNLTDGVAPGQFGNLGWLWRILHVQGLLAEIANGTVYGLDGGVWSSDPEHAAAVARRLRTGQVQINGATFNPLAPFGGYKQSGHGRELGRFGLEEFLEVKAIQR